MVATMPNVSIPPPSHAGPLFGQRVFTLRPEGHENVLLAALRERGATAMNLALIRIAGIPAGHASESIMAARSATRVLFTSPASVEHAHRIDVALGLDWFAADGPLIRCARNGGVFAPGPGTREALAQAGIEPVRIPVTRFDSEGLLELPALAGPIPGSLAIIGAPGGRGLLETTLAQRRIEVIAVHVYRREDSRPDAGAIDCLLNADRPILVASSGSALARLADVLPSSARARCLDRMHLVVASDRLSIAATDMGFRRITTARSAHVAHLVAGVEQCVANGPDASAKDDSVSMTT
jgi:uroporphyrinogen-III synthase